jgi:hypothetical protein
MSKPNSGRKAAQRMYPALACQTCGGITILQRHHKDRNPANNEPDNVEILCNPCHAAEHRRLMPVACRVCQTMFTPKRARRATVCGKACHSAWGKVTAARRLSSALQAE